jgi:hypothetical protein
VVASDRLLRWLCWSLIAFVIVSALGTLTLSGNPFSTPIPAGTDFVDRLLTYRADDQKAYILDLIGALANIGVYAIAATLGLVLRRLAGKSAATDVLASVFLVGGTVGVAGQLVNLAVDQWATTGYCDCGYKTYEVIAQGYALDMGWTVAFWLGLGAIFTVGLGAALTGWLVGLGRDFKIVSYLIAIFLIAAVVLRFLGEHEYSLSDLVVGLTSGIGVPIWAFLLARGSGRIAAQE